MTYPAMPWVVILVVSMIYRVFVLRTKNKTSTLKGRHRCSFRMPRLRLQYGFAILVSSSDAGLQQADAFPRSHVLA